MLQHREEVSRVSLAGFGSGAPPSTAGMVFPFIPQHLSSSSSSTPHPARTLSSATGLNLLQITHNNAGPRVDTEKCLKFVVILSPDIAGIFPPPPRPSDDSARQRGTRAQAAGDEWSQLPLWLCWGHGKGALGVPEVMLSPGQCPRGRAGTDGDERPLNPRPPPAPGRDQRGFAWGRTTLNG